MKSSHTKQNWFCVIYRIPQNQKTLVGFHVPATIKIISEIFLLILIESFKMTYNRSTIFTDTSSKVWILCLTNVSLCLIKLRSLLHSPEYYIEMVWNTNGGFLTDEKSLLSSCKQKIFENCNNNLFVLVTKLCRLS